MSLCPRSDIVILGHTNRFSYLLTYICVDGPWIRQTADCCMYVGRRGSHALTLYITPRHLLRRHVHLIIHIMCSTHYNIRSISSPIKYTVSSYQCCRQAVTPAVLKTVHTDALDVFSLTAPRRRSFSDSQRKHVGGRSSCGCVAVKSAPHVRSAS